MKIIKRISKESKFDYASTDSIIAEAELQVMGARELEKTLDRIKCDRIVYQPAKSNYRVSRVHS